MKKKKKKATPRPMEVFTAHAYAPRGQHVLVQLYIAYEERPLEPLTATMADAPPLPPRLEAASLKEAALLCLEQAKAYVLLPRAGEGLS